LTKVEPTVSEQSLFGPLKRGAVRPDIVGFREKKEKRKEKIKTGE
jgi:hypothetical protein